ncbi:symmetrical bis(5'-nucleosyl)-tetraphosphatase [Legionella sp. W05-934-2]|uniref:symmetrical bis(5'-nucleosyl)-tetraphosphatase n=1 Tax=Legionella sp. W05-934-2 TaxID=1198649 RepID=UPI0034624268
MADYVIGDIQGCYEPLVRLLEVIAFDESNDRLIFVGDLVNRGPDSLAVIRFIQQLTYPPVITLGNHDLHLLARIFTKEGWQGTDETLTAILEANDVEDIGHWLRKQSILYYHQPTETIICHAGIAPCWDLPTAIANARELEICLSGDFFIAFLEQMYGNEPNVWEETLEGVDRLRLITNYFTRMRFCDKQGHPLLDFKGKIDQAPPGHYPWFLVPNRVPIDKDIVFGHWAALEGHCPIANIHAIDTGCLWGGKLTAFRLEDKKRFTYPS